MSNTAQSARILEGFADEDAVAAEFKISLKTLRRWRRLGLGPPWIKAPGGVRYPIAESRDWLRRNLVQPRTKTA